MAANTTNMTPNPNEDDLRTDLHAMLAASRELGPEMDRALVDSYLERQRAAGTGSPRAVAPSQGQPGQPQPFSQATRLGAMALVIVAYVAALIVSHGWLWWLIFPLMGIFGGWWGRWGHDEHDHERHMRHRLAHDEYRMRRREMRDRYRARRRGYYLPEDDRRHDENRQDEDWQDEDRRGTPPDRRLATPANTYD